MLFFDFGGSAANDGKFAWAKVKAHGASGMGPFIQVTWRLVLRMGRGVLRMESELGIAKTLET